MNLTNFLLYGVCGGLNKNGPYRLLELNTWSLVSGSIRMCGLIKVSVTLLKEVFPWGLL